MKEYVSVLKRTRLFSGVGEEEIFGMLGCLQARVKTYQKGEYVCRQGEYLSHLMVLVEGNLHIQRDDYWGNGSWWKNVCWYFYRRYVYCYVKLCNQYNG